MIIKNQNKNYINIENNNKKYIIEDKFPFIKVFI